MRVLVGHSSREERAAVLRRKSRELAARRKVARAHLKAIRRVLRRKDNAAAPNLVRQRSAAARRRVTPVVQRNKAKAAAQG